MAQSQAKSNLQMLKEEEKSRWSSRLWDFYYIHLVLFPVHICMMCSTVYCVCNKRCWGKVSRLPLEAVGSIPHIQHVTGCHCFYFQASYNSLFFCTISCFHKVLMLWVYGKLIILEMQEIFCDLYMWIFLFAQERSILILLYSKIAVFISLQLLIKLCSFTYINCF